MKETETRYEFYSATNQRIVDGLIAGVAFYLAYQLRFEGAIPPAGRYQMWLLLGVIMLGRVLTNSLFHVYRLIWRYISLRDAIYMSGSYLAFSAILLLLRLGLPDRWWLLQVPLSIIVIEYLIALGGAVVARSLRRLLHERTHRGRQAKGAVRRAILIGAGRSGVAVAKELVPRDDIRPVGFLDDDPRKAGALINGLPVLGPLSLLPSVVSEHDVEEVIICVPQMPHATLKRMWAYCELLPVRTWMVPTLEEILQKKVNISHFRELVMADLLGRESVGMSVEHADVVAAYRDKRILITGAGGSIGSELACQLFNLKPAQLVLLDKDENGLNDTYARLQSDSVGAKVYPVVADIRFPVRLEAVLSRFRPEVVFHAAAHKHVHLMEMNPCEAVLNNVSGTRNLVELSRRLGVARFVFISTDKAVKPRSVMGATKRLCEMIVQANCRNGQTDTAFSCVRFGNVVGSRGSVVPIFQKQIANGGPVTITHAEAERFLMTIPEAVRLVIQAGILGPAGEIYVLQMGDPVSIQNLARDVIELSGLRPGKDVEIKITQLRNGEKIREDLVDEATESLFPTRFGGINVIKGQGFDPTLFMRQLSALEEAARREAVMEVYRLMQGFGIEFRPDFSLLVQSTRVGAEKLHVKESERIAGTSLNGGR
ncbi:MAG: polysaccharide biosynthesis protein [Terriglobia bacterium]